MCNVVPVPSGDDEHRLNGAQAPVIVKLLGKEVLEEGVEAVELASEHFGRDKSLRHQHVFADEDKIGFHDRHWTEESL